MALPNSIQFKIFRSTQHIESLKSELHGYFKSNPGKMVRQPDIPDDAALFRFVPSGTIPARFGLITGDALQNLRSSLDYLVWELVLAARCQPTEKNMFPICSTDELFKQQISRHRLDGVPPQAVTEIESSQPYHLGQEFNKSILWALDELTNINKHRRILLTGLAAAPVKPENIVIQDGEAWVRSGPGPVQIFDSNTEFGPFPIIDGQVQVDTNVMAGITFDEGTAKGMEVSFCLGYWCFYLMKTLLPRFEKFLP